MVDSSVAELDKPFWLLKLPCKRGLNWDVELVPTGIEAGKGTANIVAIEEIKVPAGVYKTVCVEVKMTFLGEKRELKTWYAAGVGKIKDEREGRIEVLKSITIPIK